MQVRAACMSTLRMSSLAVRTPKAMEAFGYFGGIRSAKVPLSFHPVNLVNPVQKVFRSVSLVGLMPNTFGHLFRITTWGESHGGGVGVVVDGCPPRIPLTETDIQVDLDRRRPGQSKIVTPRKESDTCQILSGTFEGQTLGTPISIWVRNEDQRPEAYKEMETLYRPSHADYTYQAKYGIRNWQGGGRASARETIGRVAGGAVAQQVFKKFLPKLEIVAFVSQVHDLTAGVSLEKISYEEVESNIVRWPDRADAERVIALIEKTRAEGDSLGGVVTCVV